MSDRFKMIALALLLASHGLDGQAAELRVAVASNFRSALEAIAQNFQASHEVQMAIIPGSTGKHYAQIVNGAPFDVLLAADSERPARLEAEAAIVPGSRYTYAIGRLVLWSRDDQAVDDAGKVLKAGGFRHLAIANPDLAPYGRAALETLASLDALAQVEPRLVRGENVAQAFQFVFSGNAELGLVAAAQIRGQAGSHWLVPAGLHTPIEQQAVLLTDSTAGRDFMAFLRSAESLHLIREAGYDTPP